MSAEAFATVVRTYADRVHDDVRRLGATPAEAADIVESSAMDVLDEASIVPTGASVALGRWFALARVLAAQLVDADDQARPPDPDASAEAPEGLIRDTDLDLVARRGLAHLSSRDRSALLLRDAYELPEHSTSVALGLDLPATRALVAAARRRFAEVTDVPASTDVPLLLRGLAILALPDQQRDAMLRRVELAASRSLPGDAELALLAADLEPAGGPSVLTVVLSLVAALLVGAMTGVVTAPVSAEQSGGSDSALPPTTEPFDVRKLDPAFATPTGTPSPTTTATAAPTTTATSSGRPTATASPSSAPTQTISSGPATITLFPASGPDCTTVRVSGRNFSPGVTVDVTYADPLGRLTPSGATTTVGPDGRFTARFEACDPNRLPGPHQVAAQGGGRRATASFTATS